MTNPDLRFKYLLVSKGIGGSTVAELCDRMSNLEYVHWVQYYALEAQEQQLARRKASGEGRVADG